MCIHREGKISSDIAGFVERKGESVKRDKWEGNRKTKFSRGINFNAKVRFEETIKIRNYTHAVGYFGNFRQWNGRCWRKNILEL